MNPIRSMTLCLLAGTLLSAQSSDYPLAINLPTAERMQFWDFGVAFTHRFVLPVKDHSKDAYGLDGQAYTGVGLDFGFKPIEGLNVLLYRTSDNKTFTMGLQQQLVDREAVRMSLRVERFDEVITHFETPVAAVGIVGTAVQLPADFFIGDKVVFSLVPTYLSRTTTQPKGVFNVGVGARVLFTERFSFVGEYYPTPSKVKSNLGTYHSGFSAGFSYKTFKHRFSLFSTNAEGTTANQVMAGDYRGGPRTSDQWSFGFNVARVF